MKPIFYLFFFFTAIQLQSQIIPENNRVDWNHAGCQYPFTEPQLIANVMNFGAAADGATNDKQAVVDAIASLNGNYGIVYFPAGTYMLQSGVSLPDSVIIRGDGADATFIKINSTGSCFGIYGNSTGIFTNIVSGIEKGSHEITVSDVSLFSIGDYIEIREDNGSWDTSPAAWAVKVAGQISKIIWIEGDNLFIEDELRMNFDLTLNPEVQKINPRKHIRIECVNIERVNTSTAGTGYNIEFAYAINCRVKGIESNKSQGSHCMINLSSHIEVIGSYFHDAYMYDGSGTKGYGVTLNSHSNQCLISNNIFRHLRHAMMTKAGANGNVFGYNYSIEVYRNGSGEFPTDYGGDISLHGHYSFANLFEGNIIQNVQIDNTWGPSGPYNTFFRNRTEHYGITMSTTLTNNSNFVGNEIIGSFPYGSYTLTGLNNFEYGNNKNGSITPSGTSSLNDISYYLNEQPEFWDISDDWPSIGINNSINTGTIPAKQRYLAGIYTDCSEEIVEELTYTSYFTGNPVDLITEPNGGVCLMGGATEHDEAMKWFLQQANGGDILVLRASGSDGYNDYLYSELGINVNSVETIVFNNASASDEDYIQQKIKNAEAIWFAGGDQWNYVSYWRNTPVDSLINEAIQNRNIVIGGTSAGMAILGGFYFTAENGTVTSAAALANPYNIGVTVDTAKFISGSYLDDVITDTHYDNPNRKGRHVVFLARIFTDYGIAAKGIACNEYTAVCIHNDGIAHVFGDYPDYEECAYFIQTNCELADMSPENCSLSSPLDWNLGGIALKVYKVYGTNEGTNSFNLNDWQSGFGGSWENWYVDNGNLIEEPGTQIDCSASSGMQVELKQDVFIFPNPCSDFVSVSSANKISIYSITGEKPEYLISNVDINNPVTIDISFLPSGIYIIKVETERDTFYRKLIKE